MSYLTLYCNEQMLLDNWKYYDESNLMLKNVLRKTEYTPEECADIYFSLMRHPESVTYPRETLVRKLDKKKNRLGEMLRTEQVVMYKKDFDYMYSALREYHLSHLEMLTMFGVIFMCRMYHSNICNLDSRFKLIRFEQCYRQCFPLLSVRGKSFNDEYLTFEPLYNLVEIYELFERIPVVALGSRYKYPLYEITESDEPAYVFTVTLENNRLNLTAIYNDAVDRLKYYCVICQRPIQRVCNAKHYCKECAAFTELKRITIRNNKNKKIIKSN